MNPERWQRVKDLLYRAMLLAPAQRGPFLDAACGYDSALRAEVQSLLAADENVRSSFLRSAPPAVGPGSDTLPATNLPARLGPYEILGRVGKGGMGEVYRGRDSRLRRYVAVKILPPELSRDPSRQKRFEREARAASALSHPNIVSVYDIGREGDIPFIVSEFVEGESLRCLAKRGPVPPAQVVGIAIQLAAGLQAAHVAGIVHRDIKPENIMLTPDRRVKILDFGLAKHLPQRADAVWTATVPLTAPGVVMGTVGYMSPEQVRREEIDQRSDIFSLGAVLYELVAGRSPFTRGNIIEVVRAILREEPAALPSNVPPALDGIIRRCLEKDPLRRFQDAASLASALAATGKLSSMQRISGAVELKRWIWWAGVAVAGAGLGYFIPHLKSHEPAAPAKPPVTVTQARTTPPPQPVLKLPAIEPTLPRIAQPGAADPPKRITAPEARLAPTVEPPPPPRPPVIETLAGRRWEFSGDGTPAIQVALGHCDDVTCDREGNIYASDWGNEAIVKIDRSGILHVVAGPGSVRRNRPANPIGLVVDGTGAIYFSQGLVIRKLLPGGRIVPFAGNNRTGFTPDGALARGSSVAEVSGIVLGTDGSVIFSERGNHRVRRVDLQGRLRTIAGDGRSRFAGDNGPALQASLSGPRGLALDGGGNLYIADDGNRCVRKVSPDGRIATVAGQGVAGDLVCPSGVAVNRRGDLFVADSCRRQVLLVRGGRMVVLGGTGAEHTEPSGDGGPATAASFDQWKLALDKDENLLVSGPDFGHVYRISQDGRFRIIAGSGKWGVPRDGTPAREAFFQAPFRLAAAEDGNVYMTDLPANRIYRIDPKGTVSSVAGYFHFGYDGENTAARDSRLNGPHGIRLSPTGTIVFADCFNNRVREVTREGRLRTLAGNGMRDFNGDGGRAVDAALNQPMGVAFDKAGNLYIADTGNNRIRKVAPDGRIRTIVGNGVAGDSGDGGGAERASLNAPRGLDVDSNGDLYIADMANHRVRRVSAGIIATLAGDGQPGYSGDGGPAAQARLDLPGDLSIGAGRQLYVMVRPTRRIRRIDLASGIITTFAGNGESTASGDGGPPTQAGLGDPAGIAVDRAGNVYVTDRESRRLRVIRPGNRN